MSKHYYYESGVRWFRWTGPGDVRSYRPPKGWEAFADLVDQHPITGKELRESQWWIRETFTGDE